MADMMISFAKLDPIFARRWKTLFSIKNSLPSTPDYTSNSGLTGIKSAGAIIPRDQNKIFAVPAKKKPLSPRDAESAYSIKPGKGNNYIDFDACPGEFSERFNPVMKITEHVHTGPIKLEGRNPTFNRN